jgi:polyisoprenoid-binding protein YceI
VLRAQPVYRGAAGKGILLLMNMHTEGRTDERNQRDEATVSTWNVDPMHTTVGFSVRHLLITNVRGVFRAVTGTVRYDRAHPERTEVRAELVASSIDTGVAPRDAHLKSAELFDVAAHPTITFVSTKARATQSGLEVTGELTLRGIRREVVLEVSDIGWQRDHNGARRMGGSASTIIRRSDFGMTYNRILEAGAVAVADEVKLTIDLSLVAES